MCSTVKNYDDNYLLTRLMILCLLRFVAVFDGMQVFDIESMAEDCAAAMKVTPSFLTWD